LWSDVLGLVVLGGLGWLAAGSAATGPGRSNGVSGGDKRHEERSGKSRAEQP